MTSTETITPTPVEKFQEKVAKERRVYNTVVAWHLTAHVDVGVELPYNGGERYIYINVQNYNETTNEYEIDEQAIITRLAKIIKYARKRGFAVVKDYGETYFTVKVTISTKDDPAGNIVISYNANRDAVCTKRVTGTEVIPAYTTPEQVVEVVEWECEKLSFLDVDTES